MANYLPIACVLNRIKCVSKKHNNEESGNKKIDKKEIAIAAITIVPPAVAAVALFIVFKTGIMDLNKAFELFGHHIWLAVSYDLSYWCDMLLCI